MSSSTESKSPLVPQYGFRAAQEFFAPSEPFKVIEVRELTKDTYVLRVDRHGMPFRAGQCVSVGLHKSGVNREYSLYSGENEPYLDLLIRAVEGGSVSPKLQRLAPGTLIDIQGPYSEFVLKDPLNESKRYLFIGTGTGISPFHSFVKTYPTLNYQIIHGVRFSSECYDSTRYASGRYVACLSREKQPGTFEGRVTQYLHENPAQPGTVCYLCGNRKMIEEVFDLLRAQGIHSDDIFTEVFF